MKKLLLPLACALVFFTCSCNSSSTKSGLLDEEVYENPHMQDDEAQKYGHMMNVLEDLDAMTKSYSANKNEEPENDFFRFSAKQLVKGTLYFKGKILVSVEDIGFNNIEEVIAHLMKDLPETIPPRSMVQIRLENKDKGLKQDYTRMIH
ncbi:MAG: hypothetical protein J6T33_05455 [Bacteroidales bacterium]|nr:hypothetical protein [Bacteroidales bacterium]